VGLGARRRFDTLAAQPFVKRNSQTVLNTAFNGIDLAGRYDPATAPMFWDVRALSLEAQALEPLKALEEMRGGAYPETAAIDTVVGRLQAIPEYRQRFARAFGGAAAVTSTNLAKAIAAFERTLVSGDSAFDRLAFGGVHDALSQEARRGMTLFFSPDVGCSGCHSGFNFAGNWVDAQGATGETSFADNGTGLRLRVPTLRNVAVTAPYMHDGRFASLAAVLAHYATRPNAAPLSESDRAALVAFLESLTDPGFLGRYSLPVIECGASTGFDCGEPRSLR
jgi:cytochrome c peroxidase